MLTLNPVKENQPAKRPRVLVVDDEKVTRRALELILKNEFEVITLESGNKAVDYIRQDQDFDVVSLDLNMPGMSGIETLKAVKQYCPTIEVLLITAFQDIESAKQALKLGAYDYIAKPVNNDVYRESIRKGVQRRQKALASEKAKEQLEIVKAQLVHSERLSAIGELLAGVVHELNNPLTGIMGYSELLLAGKVPPEKNQKYLENILQCARLCQKVVQKLLAFSRKQSPQRECVQVNDIVESTLELVEHEIKKIAIDVVRQFAEDLPRTIADFHQIQQVVLNIVSNAMQAMAQQARLGTLTIQSEFDDQAIRVHIMDTGPGIPRENLQKIFEPFYTTKAAGKGTGLGLSICYEIIQEHGGNIYVSSDLKSGSRFVIELPITAQAASIGPAAPAGKIDRTPAGKHILVIEEKEMGYDLLENMITTLQHRADVAHDALAAQAKLQNGTYDVIISNMSMPELGGGQLYEYVNRVKPELLAKIILITSGVISEENKRFLEQHRIPHINKPFGLGDIQEAIQKVAQAPPEPSGTWRETF